jgi:hypothetical protein
MRVLAEHNDAYGRHDMVFLGERQWLDKSGTHRGRGHLWLEARCNHPDCPRRVLVDAFALCDIAGIQ